LKNLIDVAPVANPIFSVRAGTNVQDRRLIGVRGVFTENGVDSPFIVFRGLGAEPEEIKVGRISF
jgi:hypothetical protein